MIEEKRIYVVVAGTIQVPVYEPIASGFKRPLQTVVQPAGRQMAQACHVVSKLRHGLTASGYGIDSGDGSLDPITTIILQARDSAEMFHVYALLRRKRMDDPVIFSDNNPEYGPGDWPTAIAVYGFPKQVVGILGYLPLWGSK